VNRLLKPFVFLVAAIYFLVDAAFWTIAHPVSRWLAELRVLDGLRTWITSLRPYPTLALFAVPLIVLEPVKPVAAYLTATGHIAGGLAVLVIGELLKLVLIERLFRLSRDKLISIPAFAWCYGKFQLAREWIESLAAWRLMRRFSLMAKRAVRRYVLDMKTSRKQGRLSLQSR
jgi:hypothetical protein